MGDNVECQEANEDTRLDAANFVLVDELRTSRFQRHMELSVRLGDGVPRFGQRRSSGPKCPPLSVAGNTPHSQLPSGACLSSSR